MQMGQQPAMAIAPPPAMGKAKLTPQRQARERRLGFARSRPFGEAGPAERQFRRLEPKESKL